MKPSKERPWIGNRTGKGGEGDLDIRGEELSTMMHYKKGRSGLKLRGWPEIGPGGGLLTNYCPLRNNRNCDDDDNDDDDITRSLQQF